VLSVSLAIVSQKVWVSTRPDARQKEESSNSKAYFQRPIPSEISLYRNLCIFTLAGGNLGCLDRLASVWAVREKLKGSKG
jgi:hypothetical protein